MKYQNYHKTNAKRHQIQKIQQQKDRRLFFDYITRVTRELKNKLWKVIGKKSGKDRLLLPWVGETPILTIEPIDDDPIDENIDDLDDEPDAKSISSISGKTPTIARDYRLHRCWWLMLETKWVGDIFKMLMTFWSSTSTVFLQ